MCCWAILRTVLFNLFVFILSILLVAVLLSLSPTAILVYTYRYLLTKSIRICRPDLYKIVTTRSQLFSVDAIHTKPKATLIAVMTVQNHTKTIQEEREFFMKNLVLKQDVKTGQLKRPEFQQYIVGWMGYQFWKWDRNFSIDNHIVEYDGPYKSDSYNEDDISVITCELATRPYTRLQSTWQYIFFRNYTSVEFTTPCTVLMLRIHHSLADGFSIMRLMNELISSDKTLELMAPTMPKLTMSQTICKNLSLFLKTPFDAVVLALTSIDVNAWRVPGSRSLNEIRVAFVSRVSVDLIKEIRHAYSVSFASVILAGFCGGTRKFMLQNGIKLPNHISCALPLPGVETPPDKLRNILTACVLRLPLGTPDPVERLKAIDKDFKRKRSSTFPLASFYLTPLFGAYPPCLVKLFAKESPITSVMTSFPGPQSSVTFNHGNASVVDIRYGGGLMMGGIGVGLASITYNGTIRIGVGLDGIHLPPNASIQTLADNIKEEFELLKARAITV